jgi:ribonucleotide monophosphatase NagD (HAD superfamily)
MKCFVVDMDGTIYLGENAIDGAIKFISELKNSGIPFRFLTNNSSNGTEFYSTRLQRMGFDVDQSCILTSTIATIRFLKEKFFGKTV